jgi:hypothetical protein
MYALKDVMAASIRLIPPLPPLYPLEPLTRNQDRWEPPSYLHLGRAIAHGRAGVTIKSIDMRLFSTPRASNIDHYFQFKVETCEIGFDGKFLKLAIMNATGIQVPHRHNQPMIVEMPHMELHLGFQFLCTEEHFESSQLLPPLPAAAAAVPTHSMTTDDLPTTPLSINIPQSTTLPSQWPPASAAGGGFSISLHPPSSSIDSTPARPATPRGTSSHPHATLTSPSVAASASFSEGLNLTANANAVAAGMTATTTTTTGPSGASNKITMGTPIGSGARRLSIPQGSLSPPPPNRRSPSGIRRLARPPPLSTGEPTMSPTSAGMNTNGEPDSPTNNGVNVVMPWSLCPLVHECNVHISLSIYFAKGNQSSLTAVPFTPTPSGFDDVLSVGAVPVGSPSVSSKPLSVTLHSNSVAWLVQFGMLYSRIPPLPFPKPFKRNHQYPFGNIPLHVSPPMTNVSITSTIGSSGSTETKRGPTFSANSMTRTLARRPILGTAGSTPARAAAALASIAGAPIGTNASLLDRGDGKRGGPPSATPSGSVTPLTASSSIAAGLNFMDDDSIPVPPLNIKHETHVRLCALYIESVIIEQAALTIWEGQEDLGPARGLQLAVDLVYFSTEIAEEAGLTRRPVDELRSAKIYLPQLSGSYWTVANTTIGIEGMAGQLVHNAKWTQLVKQEQERERNLNNIIGANRVVVHTYENERYSLGRGWSAGNLLPTDRFAWSNADGLQVSSSYIIFA